MGRRLSRTSLWSLFAAFVLFVALEVVKPIGSRELGALLQLALPMGLTIVVIWRCDRWAFGRDIQFKAWRVALGALVYLWVLFGPLFEVPGPDATRYYDAQYAITNAAAWLMACLVAMGAPEPTRASIPGRLLHAFWMLGRFIDEGQLPREDKASTASSSS